MRYRLAIGIFFALTISAAAQDAGLVVQSCGSLAKAYAAGQVRPFTVDTTGTLCSYGSGGGGGGGGGGAVYGPTAPGSAPTNPPVVNGYVDGSGNVQYVAPSTPFPISGTVNQGTPGGSAWPVSLSSLPAFAANPTFKIDPTSNFVQTAEQGSSSASVGITPTLTASGTSQVAKASQGNLYSVYATNLTATAGFIVTVNAATAPSSGASITAQECLPLNANNNSSINYGGGPPDAYSTGIVVLISTSCTTYTPGGNAFIKSRVR